MKFDPLTLRLSLGEASDGQVSSIFDRIVMTCFQYNAADGKYTLAAWGAMRLAAVTTMSVLAVVLIPVWIRAIRDVGTPGETPAIETDIDENRASDTIPAEEG